MLFTFVVLSPYLIKVKTKNKAVLMYVVKQKQKAALVTTPRSRKDIFVQFAHSDAAAYVARSNNASRADKHYVFCDMMKMR